MREPGCEGKPYYIIHTSARSQSHELSFCLEEGECIQADANNLCGKSHFWLILGIVGGVIVVGVVAGLLGRRWKKKQAKKAEEKGYARMDDAYYRNSTMLTNSSQ